MGSRSFELRSDVAEAVRVALDASRSATLLVEEHVAGIEVTVNAFSVGGALLSAHGDGPFDRTAACLRRRTDARLAERARAGQIGAVVEAAAAAAAAVGIENGPSYTQVLVGPDGPRVGELAARLGGGHDAELCRVALGVDLNGAALSAALGEEIHVDEPCARGACRRRVRPLPRPPPGELREVTGIEEAFAQAGIRGIRIYRRPGHRFEEFRRGPDRAGAILAVGESREEALERASRAEATIRFETDVEALV